MKLLLHIGTHKTGSSSLQRFFTAQRSALKDAGIFYPVPDSGTKNFNGLAASMARGEDHTTDFKRYHSEAGKNGCETVLISAESFYGMTAFFIDPEKRDRVASDYFGNEHLLIQNIKKQLQIFDNINIITYIRPQDDFAGSLYNQLVKQDRGIAEDYQTFLARRRPIFDYQNHIAQWSDVFGAGTLTVRSYSACQKDIVHDFCAEILGARDLTVTDKKYTDNPKLTRDLLEFKRRFNAREIAADKAYALMISRCLRRLNARFPDQDGRHDHIYAPLTARQSFFDAFEQGNRSLFEKYAIPPFPAVTMTSDSVYRGLEPQREAEIEKALAAVVNRPKQRILLALRRLTHRLERRMPATHGSIFQPLRALRSRILHKAFTR